jgi:diguanylate cyclase (GGDEF)-like protein
MRKDKPRQAAAEPWLAQPTLTPSTDFRFMRRMGIAMFLVGCLTLLATLSLPDPNPSDHTAIEVLAALLALGAVFVAANRLERIWIVHVWVLYGIVLVSALMAITRPIEATPFFYLWPIVFSGYFFSRRAVALDLLVMWVTLGVALFVWSHDPMKQVMFMGVGVSVSLTAIVITLLGERLTQLIAELGRASNTDHLTGLLNRRAFDAELKAQVARALRSRTPLALALFDLDHFKDVNDRYGHPAGDRLLCDFSALLAAKQRRGDTLARIGGEEFAVVLFDAGLPEAVAFAQRIGAMLREQTGERELPLSTSAGVATLADSGEDPAALLLAADRALYAAKAAGRRRVATWSDDQAAIADCELLGEPAAVQAG